jgi:hypothetical protein
VARLSSSCCSSSGLACHAIAAAARICSCFAAAMQLGATVRSRRAGEVRLADSSCFADEEGPDAAAAGANCRDACSQENSEISGGSI